MNFIKFILNIISTVVSAFFIVMAEIVIFFMIYKNLVETNPVVAKFLGIIFIIWVAVDLFLNLFVHGVKGIVHFIFKR